MLEPGFIQGRAPAALRAAAHLTRLLALGSVFLVSCSAHAPEPGRPASPLSPVGTTPNAAGEEIVLHTNSQRKALGLPQLLRNAALMQAAQLQASQMAGLAKMAHELPGAAYPTLDARLDAVGYRAGAAGENVAEGYPSSAAVVAGWMTSPGHRANIVSTHYTEMGGGVATARNGRRYYAQVFGAKR